MVTLTGLDHASFENLHELFVPYFEALTPRSKSRCVTTKKKIGRKRFITSRDCLALCLAWTRTRGSTYVLSMIFGQVSATVSIYLKFGRHILLQILDSHPSAQVKIPNDNEIAEYKNTIRERHPTLRDVWLTMDGLKIYTQQSASTIIQNRYYNGWTHDHYITNILGFTPAGTIAVACTNVPGSIHDSQVCEWGQIYEQLDNVYERNGGMVLVDSAFCRKSNRYLIKSSQAIPGSAEEILINDEATSMRQAAEWGMHTFQSSFPRIRDRLYFEEKGERNLILKLLVLLFNYRANEVGISQIRNTYMKELQRDANIFSN